MTTYTVSVPSYTYRKDGVVFLADDNDPEWVIYMAWVALENGATEIPDPIPEYPRITALAYRVMKAMVVAGIDEQVDTAVMASGDRLLIAWWRFANEWNSDFPPFVTHLAELNLTEQQAYDLFITAFASTPEDSLSMTAPLS